MAEVVVAKNGLEDLFDVIQWKALKEGKQMTRVMRKLETRL